MESCQDTGRIFYQGLYRSAAFKRGNTVGLIVLEQISHAINLNELNLNDIGIAVAVAARAVSAPCED